MAYLNNVEAVYLSDVQLANHLACCQRVCADLYFVKVARDSVLFDKGGEGFCATGILVAG